MCTVGKRIKVLREKQGFSQVDFSNAIGVSKQLLYKYENDIITNIPSDKIELAAKKLDVPPAVLMGWEKGEDLDIALSDLEHDIVTAFRSADELSKQMVLRILNINTEESSERNLA